jgi:probable rRNA maturation factor
MLSFNIELENFKLIGIRKKKNWIKDLIAKEAFNLVELNYVFVSDEALLEINRKYLNHDTYTDIITFDNSENNNQIEGDIFISVERIKENSVIFNNNFETELLRVMAHGVLHLCGYGDKKEKEVKIMREKENFYIQSYGQF